MKQNWPTVEAGWWVCGGLLYYSFYFKNYVWNISSQKALWRLTPAFFSTLISQSPYRGASGTQISPWWLWFHILLDLHTWFHLSKVLFLLFSHSSSLLLLRSHSLIYSPWLHHKSYHIAIVFCFLCWSVAFLAYFSVSPVHSQCIKSPQHMFTEGILAGMVATFFWSTYYVPGIALISYRYFVKSSL